MNLEHCFTASMTAHSISILSVFKMSFFAPYAGEKTRSPSMRYQLNSVEGRAKCTTVPQLWVKSWLVHALPDKAVN